MTETLPDIKVVRTDFLVNSGGVLLLCITGFLAGELFLRSMQVDSQIETLTQETNQKSAANQKAIADNTKFVEIRDRLTEAVNFARTPFFIPDLMVSLGENLPEATQINRITLSPPAAPPTARGANLATAQWRFMEIEGETRALNIDEASTRVVAYRDAIAALGDLKPLLLNAQPTYELTLENRAVAPTQETTAPALSTVRFTIRVPLKFPTYPAN